ncbi:MAG: nickel insertion protein [Pseudanabaenaceae cyanobacterium bins.39]|nr:nickel insertion protein [Pseudanabaenaceae cyanobacterium bins.39]
MELEPRVETVTVLETQVDDMTAQAIAYTTEQLLRQGALDVYTQAIAMKKSRLGTMLTVICPCDRQAQCEEILFRETSTLGIRYRQQQRKILPRQIHTVVTPYGSARVKIAKRGNNWTIQPEYEDCANLARSHNLPLLEMQTAVLEAAKTQLMI